ncbi:MAG TPA: nucleotide exchange factor GrpE [Candidatus Deferrimicrobium sp.]|nr:nucleotide exchange factor GrpE [Candidatus Deferrimicrobium sp.]
MTDHDDIVEVSYTPDEEEEEEKAGDEKNDEEGDHTSDIPVRKKSHGAKKVHKKIKELLESVQKLTEERDELKDKYLRHLAEMDNFRKRVKKEKDEFQKYALADFLLGLLEVLDNLERALKSRGAAETPNAPAISSSEKSIISGVEMIHKQMLDILKRNGVEEIDALGRNFDPNIHQALSKEEREGLAAPVVLEVYQKGFTYNGKLLRAALTKVAVPAEKKADANPEPEGENKSS